MPNSVKALAALFALLLVVGCAAPVISVEGASKAQNQAIQTILKEHQIVPISCRRQEAVPGVQSAFDEYTVQDAASKRYLLHVDKESHILVRLTDASTGDILYSVG